MAAKAERIMLVLELTHFEQQVIKVEENNRRDEIDSLAAVSAETGWGNVWPIRDMDEEIPT